MTRVGSIVIAVCLGMAVTMASTMTPTVAYAQQTKGKVSKAVGEPLNAAKAATQKRQFDVALAEIKKAQAVEKKSAFEESQIDEFLAYVYTQQKKYAEAAQVYERTLTSLPADKADERTKLVAQLYFEGKDYKKATEWTKRWLDKHKGQEAMTAQLAFIYFLTNDFKNAAATMGPLVNSVEKSGRVPNEDHVKLLLSSQFKLENKEGTGDALKKMIRYYPKPEYWENLVDIYRNKTNSNDSRITLGFFRLMNEVRVLKSKGDYVEMAQLGIETGVAGESQQIVESGMSKGVLKSADKTEQGRYDRLLAAAKKQATTSKASLPQMQKDADKATTGQADIGLGQAYLGYGQVDEAIASLERGIKKGGVTDLDEANVSLGVAYLRKGQKDQARKAFKAVKVESKWNDLAELWVLHSQSNA